MAGGQVTYEFGYCPYGYRPFCCTAVVSPLASSWRVICAYAAAFRLPLALILAVAFRLKSMNPSSEAGSKAVSQGWGKTNT